MKVRSLFVSKSVARRVAAAAIASALVGAAALTPLMASAETAPAASPSAFLLRIASLPSFTTTLTPSAEASRSLGAPATGTVAAKLAVPKAAKKLTIKQRIMKVGKSKGLSGTEISALVWIAKHESGFHPAEVSSAGCHGLFQLSAGMSAGHPWKNPEWNTQRAIKYMKGRYGGVLKAQSFWKAHHWY